MDGIELIVGSAPLRVSLLGGGTDIPSFFKHELGAVLGGSIDKRVFVCVLDMVDSAEYPFRFTYRHVDNASSKSALKHPVWRELLIRNKEIKKINAATFSDVPGNSGLGSSSAFSVAAIASLKRFQNQNIDPESLAREAIAIEREILKEPGGWQDQLHSAFGGFRLYQFKSGSIIAGEKLLSTDELAILNQSCILVKVGIERESMKFHLPVGEDLSDGEFLRLQYQSNLALKGAESLNKNMTWDEKFLSLSDLVSENWDLKKVNNESSNSLVDDLIKFGLKNGATASKLCGAGGSGYVLFLGYPDGIRNLKEKLEVKRILEFNFDSRGVEAIEI